MKNSDLFNAINDINFDFVEDASFIAPKNPKFLWVKWCSVAAFFCICIYTLFYISPFIENDPPVVEYSSEISTEQSSNLTDKSSDIYSSDDISSFSTETSSDFSSNTDVPSYETPSTPDEPSSEAPSIPDEPSSGSPSIPDEPSSESPSIPDEPSSEVPSIPDEPSSEIPGMPDELSSEIPGMPDELSSEAPSIPDEPSSEIPGMPDELSSESPSIPDEPSFENSYENSSYPEESSTEDYSEYPSGEYEGSSEYTSEEYEGSWEYTSEEYEGSSEYTSEEYEGSSEYSSEEYDGSSEYTSEEYESSHVSYEQNMNIALGKNYSYYGKLNFWNGKIDYGNLLTDGKVPFGKDSEDIILFYPKDKEFGILFDFGKIENNINGVTFKGVFQNEIEGIYFSYDKVSIYISDDGINFYPVSCSIETELLSSIRDEKMWKYTYTFDSLKNARYIKILVKNQQMSVALGEIEIYVSNYKIDYSLNNVNFAGFISDIFFKNQSLLAICLYSILSIFSIFISVSCRKRQKHRNK